MPELEIALHEIDVYTQAGDRHLAIAVPVRRADEIVRRRLGEEYDDSLEHDRIILVEVCQSVSIGAMPGWLVGVDAGELRRMVRGGELLFVDPVRAE